jgi:hypothetical protein
MSSFWYWMTSDNGAATVTILGIFAIVFGTLCIVAAIKPWW